jgi:phosphohistidine phosphatase
VTRRLVLLRHAKSAWPAGVPDHERPLAGKGRRNAKAAGEWLRQQGPAVDLVLCSDAVRARQTWEIASAALASRPELTLLPALYGADPQDVVELLREHAGAAATVLLVGHEPTMSGTSTLLAGAGSDPDALNRIGRKFPTSAISVLRTGRRWAELGPGQAVLETFAVPRA